jgi:chromosome partitioning protein
MLGVRLLLETVQEIRQEVNQDLTVLGILPTRFDGRTLHARETLEETRQALGGTYRIFDPPIKESVRFKESPITGQSILTYAGRSEGAASYRKLAEEIDRGEAS